MKRFICLLFGHNYRLVDIKTTQVGMITEWGVRVFKCKRCNKIKKELQ